METTLKKIKPKNISMTKQNITDFLLGMLGFFMGRIIIFESINPLAISYMSSFFLEGRSFYVVSFFTLIGIITRFTLENSLEYILCIIFLCFINFVLKNKRIRYKPVLQSVLSGIAMMISGIIVAFIDGGYVYYLLMAVLQGILTFCLSFIIKKGMMIARGKIKYKTVSTEALISLSIVAAGIVAGSADVFIGEVSLRYYFCSILIMMMAFKAGGSMGATSGLLLGLLLNVSGYEPVGYIIVLAIAGLIAGSMRELAKQFISAGFAIGCIVMAFYIQPELIRTEFLFSVLFAGITFILLPEKFMLNFNSSYNSSYDNSDIYIEKLKETTKYKLHGFSNAFDKLSKTFSGISEKRTALDPDDVSNLIDESAGKVCIDCEKVHICWEHNFYNTYQNIFSMLDACERNGSIYDEDISEDFRNICINLPLFADTISRVFELYKTNFIWHNRIIESRELVSEQLKGVSKIIDNLAYELDLEVQFREDLEKLILDELEKNKIEVESIIVSENKLSKYEVNISHKACYNKKECVKVFIPLIGKILGRKMAQDEMDCFITKENGKSICKLRFIEEQKFKLSTGVARLVKSNQKISGDSFSFMELKNGQSIMALSDGMGTGKKAMEESKVAIELLEEFIETGFDNDISVRMINSVLLLKSSQDSFSTLDICSVDLYSGTAEFMKIGASSTFVIRGKEVSVLRSWSLPVGIVSEIDLDISTKELMHGDIIVMVTDGILDIEKNEVEKEKWIKETLVETDYKNPQDIADYLIEKAKVKCKGDITDDMTVLVGRLWEKI